MIRKKLKKQLLVLFLSGLLAGEITVLADLAAAWFGIGLHRLVYFGGFGVLTLLFFCIPWFTAKRLTAAGVGIPVFLAVTGAAGFLFWKSFSTNGVYREVDSGKAQLYADRRVMVIVPHEDDEVNILGGVMEEYVKYGSQLYPVFITNGDMEGLAETRFAEALAVADYIGIPRENVTFLGYGDQWSEDGPHIYNAQPGVVVTSRWGRTETYGTQAKEAFREGRAYTVDNLTEDLKTVILECRPDTIFCSDYDRHIDHKATTLLFEKVMGEILKEEPDYRPAVYKGYAYTAAWYSVSDYYTTNIRSTCNVFAEPLYQEPGVYRWEDRVRLPVKADALSRSICSSGVFQTLALHASQNAIDQASRVINGDRVVWQRETDSVCYGATIEASSGNAYVLNDFMLLENLDLVDESRKPYDGAWIPNAEDGEKTVTVTFPEPVTLARIVLYDHPSEEENVLDAVIRFDDGTEVRTGQLDPGGAATEISVEKTTVQAFSVTLAETQGAQAGLTEVEAFREEKEADFGYIKLMDEAENFVYDYWLDDGGEAEFFLYSHGTAGGEGYDVSWDNAKCGVTLENGVLSVSCPEGEETVITVSCAKTGVSDSVSVSNPGFFRRLQCSICQKLEERLMPTDGERWYFRSVTYELLDILRYRVGKLLP